MKVEYFVKLLTEEELSPAFAKMIVGFDETTMSNEKLLEVIKWSQGSIKEITLRGTWDEILATASQLPPSLMKLNLIVDNIEPQS